MVSRLSQLWNGAGSWSGWLLLAIVLGACAVDSAPLHLSAKRRRAVSDCLSLAEKLNADARDYANRYLTEVLQCCDSDCKRTFSSEPLAELPTRIEHCPIRKHSQEWSFDGCFTNIAGNLRIYEGYLESLRGRSAIDMDSLLVDIRAILTSISSAQVDVPKNQFADLISSDVVSKIYSSEWETRRAGYQILDMFRHMASIMARSLNSLNQNVNPQ